MRRSMELNLWFWFTICAGMGMPLAFRFLQILSSPVDVTSKVLDLLGRGDLFLINSVILSDALRRTLIASLPFESAVNAKHLLPTMGGCIVLLLLNAGMFGVADSDLRSD